MTPGHTGTEPVIPPAVRAQWAVAHTALRSQPATAPHGVRATVGGPAAPMEVTTGVLDNAADHAFRNGQCHAMALALFERIGGAIVAWGYDDCDPLPSCVAMGGLCLCQIRHLLVRVGDDEFVDVGGRSDFEDLRWYSDDEEGLHMVPADLLHHLLWESTSWARPDIAVARTFVDAVLALEA